MAANPKHTIHEITRNLTKQHKRMLISDVPVDHRFEQPVTFWAKPLRTDRFLDTRRDAHLGSTALGIAAFLPL